MPVLLDLFLTFMRIGGLSFGGGYAMLPMLEREVVNNHGWTTREEMMDWFAIGQCTPGIIAVNVATFVGYKQKGALGGICATLGVVFPSLVIITVIAAVLQNFADIPAVKNAFAGIRVCVCVLIISAIRKLWKSSVIDITTAIIFGLVFLASTFLSLSPVIFVLLAACAGLVIKGWEAKRG